MKLLTRPKECVSIRDKRRWGRREWYIGGEEGETEMVVVMRKVMDGRAGSANGR